MGRSDSGGYPSVRWPPVKPIPSRSPAAPIKRCENCPEWVSFGDDHETGRCPILHVITDPEDTCKVLADELLDGDTK